MKPKKNRIWSAWNAPSVFLQSLRLPAPAVGVPSGVWSDDGRARCSRIEVGQRQELITLCRIRQFAPRANILGSPGSADHRLCASTPKLSGPRRQTIPKMRRTYVDYREMIADLVDKAGRHRRRYTDQPINAAAVHPRDQRWSELFYWRKALAHTVSARPGLKLPRRPSEKACNAVWNANPRRDNYRPRGRNRAVRRDRRRHRGACLGRQGMGGGERPQRAGKRHRRNPQLGPLVWGRGAGTPYVSRRFTIPHSGVAGGLWARNPGDMGCHTCDLAILGIGPATPERNFGRRPRSHPETLPLGPEQSDTKFPGTCGLSAPCGI